MWPVYELNSGGYFLFNARKKILLLFELIWACRTIDSVRRQKPVNLCSRVISISDTRIEYCCEETDEDDYLCTLHRGEIRNRLAPMEIWNVLAAL